MNRPYSEATRDLAARAIHDHRYRDLDHGGDVWASDYEERTEAYALADGVLDALAAAGLLLPEGAETRTEWGVRLVWDDGRPDDIFPAADHADAVGRFRTHRRMRAQGGWLVTPHIVRREALSYASPWTPSDAEGRAVGDSKAFQDPSVSVEETPL